PAPLLVGYDHLDLFVRDRPAARQFFEKGLGMDLLGDGPEHTFLLFGDVVLGLHDQEGTGVGLGGIDHLALRVRQFDGLRERLVERGLVPTEEREREDSHSLFLAGPEGLQVELVYRPEPHRHD
ncbi:MAG: VOC family protein, partial [Thermoplasmata archaeon]|nr:VOC family protein [Thermoplasmata archaeon]